MNRPDARIDSVRARAYRIPTEAPEADGTFAWDHTTIVIAEGTGRKTLHIAEIAARRLCGAGVLT